MNQSMNHLFILFALYFLLLIIFIAKLVGIRDLDKYLNAVAPSECACSV
jgi:hypothetical protein